MNIQDNRSSLSLVERVPLAPESHWSARSFVVSESSYLFTRIAIWVRVLRSTIRGTCLDRSWMRCNNIKSASGSSPCNTTFVKNRDCNCWLCVSPHWTMPLNTGEANARCLEETWNLAKGSCSTFDVDEEQSMAMWKEESGDAWEGASIGGLTYSWLLRSLTLRAVPDARNVESTAWFSRKYCEKIGKSNVLKLIEHYPFHDEGHILHGWSSENDDSRQGRCPPRGLAYVSALTHKVCFLLRSSRVSLQCCELHFRDPLSSLLKCFCSCPKAYSVFEVSIVGRISTWSVLFLHALITWIFPEDAGGACAGSFRIWRCRTVPHALPVRRSRNVSFRSTA